MYEDGVYEPVKAKRINPFTASDKLMNRTAECGVGKDEACGSKTGKTAFLVFFGQQVVEEILDAQRPGCPPEYFNIEIQEKHELSKTKKEAMPFLRSRWSQSTGHSPGNPRQQVTKRFPIFKMTYFPPNLTLVALKLIEICNLQTALIIVS